MFLFLTSTPMKRTIGELESEIGHISNMQGKRGGEALRKAEMLVIALLRKVEEAEKHFEQQTGAHSAKIGTIARDFGWELKCARESLQVIRDKYTERCSVINDFIETNENLNSGSAWDITALVWQVEEKNIDWLRNNLASLQRFLLEMLDRHWDEKMAKILQENENYKNDPDK